MNKVAEKKLPVFCLTYVFAVSLLLNLGRAACSGGFLRMCQEITELINIARMEVFLIGLAVDKLTALVSCQRVNHKGPFFTIESNFLFM